MTGISGFAHHVAQINGINLSHHIAGSGKPLILLHGYPQNHMCWNKIAPSLSKKYTTVIPDLRGYGNSSTPLDDSKHTVYSKRVMAADITQLMDTLDFQSACIVGHDRGARVAYRLALDAPLRVDRLVIMEIVPTGEFWNVWNAELAHDAYHWTFLSQPAPLPEKLISANPDIYVDWTLSGWTNCKSLAPFDPEALASYRKQMNDPARIAAMCADYRAGFTTDRQIDDLDRKHGKVMEAPVKVLWGSHGFPAKSGNPLTFWKRWAKNLTGSIIPDCGHFMMEENPKLVLKELNLFFS